MRTPDIGLRSPLQRARHLWDRLRNGYWLIPLTCVIVAVIGAFTLIGLDRYLYDRNRFSWTYAGGPENASDTLTTIASSMITFTGLVFSITVLALQLTSSQFSPRALRNFLRDRVAQFSLGVFLATFAYSFAALSVVRVASEGDPSFVPGLTITGAFALIGVSLIMFVQYIHHMAQSVRVVTIIERIAKETRETIDELYPPEGSDQGQASAAPLADPHRVIHVLGAPSAGVIVDLDLDGMASWADDRDARVEVLHQTGSYVCEGQPILVVWTLGSPGDGWDALHQFVSCDTERSMRRDAAFGLRQLVDIAERALSPGMNDPTTAVQCLDRIHDLLRRLSTREVPPVRTAAIDGVVRALAPSPSFDDYVGLGTEEIWRWGRESLQVQIRLRSLFDDLLDATTDPHRREGLRRRADALAAEAVPPAWPPTSSHPSSSR